MTPAEVADQFLGQQLINRAAFLLDNGEWEAYANCFVADGKLARPSDPTAPLIGRPAILQSLRERPPRRSAHLITNTFFTDVGRDTITATSRALLLTGPSGDEAPVEADKKMVIGTFVDRLVREDRAWLFAERRGGLELRASWGAG